MSPECLHPRYRSSATIAVSLIAVQANFCLGSLHLKRLATSLALIFIETPSLQIQILVSALGMSTFFNVSIPHVHLSVHIIFILPPHLCQRTSVSRMVFERENRELDPLGSNGAAEFLDATPCFPDDSLHPSKTILSYLWPSYTKPLGLSRNWSAFTSDNCG